MKIELNVNKESAKVCLDLVSCYLRTIEDEDVEMLKKEISSLNQEKEVLNDTIERLEDEIERLERNNNEKSADEMFDELGYEFDEDQYFLYYSDLAKKLWFGKSTGLCSITTNESLVLSINEARAIVKKLEEMGAE